MDTERGPGTLTMKKQLQTSAETMTLGMSLDIARGLAALFVFCFHLSGTIALASPGLGALAAHGYLGVPIFFVISGYCMAASAHQTLLRGQSANGFLRKRFLRIYPAFWASIVVIMAVPYFLAGLSALKTGHYLAPSTQWLSLGPADWFQIVTLSRVFFGGDETLAQSFSEINIVFWTLAIEFQFYLVIYLSLLWRRHFFLILSIVTIAGFSTFYFPLLNYKGLFLSFWPMFALGLLLYVSIRKNYTLHRSGAAARFALPNVLLILVTLAIFLAAYSGTLIETLEQFFPDAYFGFAVLTAVMFWLLASINYCNGFFRLVFGFSLTRHAMAFGVFLGSISYSVYLLHTKIYQIPETFARQIAGPDNPIYYLTILVGTILLSWLFYAYFEKPFISRKR